MDLEPRLRQRLLELIATGNAFVQLRDPVHVNHIRGAEYGRDRRAAAGALLASATAIVQAIFPSEAAPHRRFVQQIVGNGAHLEYVEQVSRVVHILGNIETDLRHGLYESIEDNAVAMTFDNLLDHADDYLTHDHVPVAGVVAGVAFEDAMRRLRAKRGVLPDDIEMEPLIVALTKDGTLTGLEAKRARAASGVRDKATHAKWEEFKKPDVEACIHFTRGLISEHLS